MSFEDQVVIVAAKRTAIGAFGGGLASVPAPRLSSFSLGLSSAGQSVIAI